MSAQQHNAFVEHFKLVFFVDAQEHPIRAEVTPKAMIQCFDADMTPRSFLEIYERQQNLLHRAALAKAGATDATIVLDTEDLDALTVQQQPEGLATPISLRAVTGGGKPYRRDRHAPAASAQDMRFATQIGA